MKPIDEMNENELWEEFTTQLIRDSAAPLSMNYDDCELFRKNGIRECVKRWQSRLQKRQCFDAISRAYAIELLEERFLELQKIKKIPGNEKQEDVQFGINWCINTIREMDGAVATTPVAVVKIDESDIKNMIQKKFDDFVKSLDPDIRRKGKWIYTFNGDAKFLCSNCGLNVNSDSINFCPQCGADMRGESNEID